MTADLSMVGLAVVNSQMRTANSCMNMKELKEGRLLDCFFQDSAGSIF